MGGGGGGEREGGGSVFTYTTCIHVTCHKIERRGLGGGMVCSSLQSSTSEKVPGSHRGVSAQADVTRHIWFSRRGSSRSCSTERPQLSGLRGVREACGLLLCVCS